MAIQLLTLKPLGAFFFGGESGFGQGLNQNYYVRSMLFPQQTTVLGMLRFELLKSSAKAFNLSEMKVKHESEAKALIGASGFDAVHEDAYGALNCLSPVFLLSPDGVPHLMSAACRLEGNTAASVQAGKPPGSFKAQNLLSGAVYQQGLLYTNGKGKPYDGKQNFASELISKTGDLIPVFYDEATAPKGVFVLQDQTGNQKEYGGESDESGFYKQDRYDLRPGWKFAVLAEFGKALPADFGKHSRVQLGGERCMFLLETQAADGEHFGKISSDGAGFTGFETLYGRKFPNHTKSSGLALLSDTWLPGALTPEPDFAISDTISFRHLTADLRDPNELWTSDAAPKSHRYNLYRRGSVFLSKVPATYKTQIEAVGAFRRIGYNYCITF